MLNAETTPREEGDSAICTLASQLISNAWLGLPGEATASKTQLCLQLMLNAQRPLHEGGLGGATL